ncbi:hypothetical protein [Phenylobacterium sp.]|uniref:hypothetical protein n=1 Tax=Phenylobacterium sp. TaxID=1871053 RepID=UPI002F92D0D2
MRKIIGATVAGLALVGSAAAMTSTAQAQPGYYYNPQPYYGGYNPGPYYNNGYPNGYYAPGYNYNRGYYGNDGSLAGIAGAVLGSVLGGGYAGGYGYGNVPVDQYGPDPNGMIGPDGRRIKCKLKRTYDSYYRGYVTRRECRSR